MVKFIFQVRQQKIYFMHQTKTNADNSLKFDTSFFQRSCKFNEQLSAPKWKLTPVKLFPMTSFIKDGDLFFEKIWHLIDNSKRYFWMTTYAMNSSPTADAVFYKLIDAAKRGVHVVLFIDNVQHWARQSLISELQSVGGTVQILNPQFKLRSIKKYFTKQVWRRHHEKLIVTDNKAIIGSSNIQQNYGGVKYGNLSFMDLNFYSENIILDQFRRHFFDVAKKYDFSFKKVYNQQTKEYDSDTNLQKYEGQLNDQFPNSTFYKQNNYKLLHNDTDRKREIQIDIINQINLSKKSVRIVQPYFFNMIRFNNAMQKAAKRGVYTQMITTKNRQQIVFKNMKNEMFFHDLIKKGTTVLETKERLLHSKLYLIDGKYVNLGSMNNDRWSWMINNQLNIRIVSERAYQELLQYYNTLKSFSKQEVSSRYKLNLDNIQIITFWMNFLYSSETVMGRHNNLQEDCIQYDPEPILDDDE